MKRKRILSLMLAIAPLVVGCGGDSPSSPSGPTSPGGPTGNRVISLNGSLDFGSVNGGASRDLTFSIVNSGNEAITVSGITVPSGFTVSWSNGTVAPGQQQSVTVRFTPTLDQSYSGTLTVVSNASGSNTLNISARGIRTGRVNDPVGDTGTDARVAVPPDLTSADVSVMGGAGGVLSITLTFASGTVSSPGDISSFVVLDTDENPATGFAGVDPLTNPGGRDSGVIGVEYMIWFVNPRGSTVAEIYQVPQTGSRQLIGTTGVAFQGNQFVIGVPLALLGGDDGRLGFKAFSGKWADASSERIRGFDYLPDLGLPPAQTP